MLSSKSIGNKIVAARKKINLSQAELAGRVSISPQAVGKWERGESIPDILTLNRLAEIFGVDLNYFSDEIEGRDEAAEYVIENANEARSNRGSNRKLDWNWDMSQGNWTDADFSGLKNLKEKFSSSNLRNCTFKKSDLSGLFLEKNNIEICDFSESDLRGSRIKSSNLLNNQFKRCSFIDAELFKSNIEKCDFSEADFSGTELLEINLEQCTLDEVIWKFTKFKRTNLSNIHFSGLFEDCHFEHCSFYKVKFENAIIRNSFFKYNDRFKKVEFVNCKVDSITLAFLKNNQANLKGISLLE